MTIEVIYADVFFRAACKLQKRYPHVVQDVDELEALLKAGETPGDRLDNLAPYIVYKARVKNSDAKRGKSGGYRVIYYLRTAETIYMVYIYSKSDQRDVDDRRLRQIIAEIEESAKKTLDE